MHLSSLGCKTILCSTIEELHILLRTRPDNSLVIMTSRRNAKQIKKISKSEGRSIKSSQFVIVTAKLHKISDNFQYILKRPISPHILMDILKHIIHGQTLLADYSPNLVQTPSQSMVNSPNNDKEKRDINIMIIDDDDFVRIATIRQLEFYSIKVTGFDNPKSGLEEIKSDKNKIKYDAIFVDFNMPDMNGLEFTEEIRKFEKEKNIPKSYIVCIFDEMLLSYSIDR